MRILFQGDSITDAGRSRDNDAIVGVGYPLLVKSELGYEKPGKYEFVNRGISGNRIVDLYARIKGDILNIKPDIMSILIGVNDVWHDYSENPNGVDAEKFFRVYSILIEEVQSALPELKIMILEPFALKGAGTEADWSNFRAEVEKRAIKAKEIADKFCLPFISLQAGFDALAEKAPAEYWLADGVHPTPMGHEFIKEEWLKAFKTL